MERILEYDQNGLARVSKDTQWTLYDRAGNQVGGWHSYIEESSEGYYRVEQGAKKNLMRPDGTVVLKNWHDNVFEVKKGFFLFSKTIRKSKTNPQTRYVYGMAHVSGIVIFPPIFERARAIEEIGGVYAEIEGKPYVLSYEGTAFDPARGHLPKKVDIDSKDFFEKFCNWTMPGLQFFYRDTDAPIDVNATYHVGEVVRAGFFIDVTTKLYKPVHKTRFIIGSAHTAMLYEIEELCQRNPHIKDWNLCTLHFNSYFKVMDVYEKDGVTQVFLLHIPPSAAFFLRTNETNFQFNDEETGKSITLVEKARQSLDEKLQMDVHPRSLDLDFCERMYHPVGLDNEFNLVPTETVVEPEEGEIAALSQLVHKLADDADIKGYIKTDDNFPFQGIKNTICERCIFAKDIKGKGEKCGKLDTKDFRSNYLKGCCEHRKTRTSQLSQYEEREARNKRIAQEKAEKSCDIYALNLLKRFITERLDGDIAKLKYFDFNSLKEDTEFGDSRVSASSGLKTMLMKAILSLAFGDTYSDLTYENIENGKYAADTINITNTIFGVSYEDNYVTFGKFNVPDELKQRIILFGRKECTIGNTMILPYGLHQMRDTKPLGRGYTDVFLQEFHKMMIGERKCNMKLLDALKLKRKEIESFRNEDNFYHIVHELLLEDFLDNLGKPRQVFQGLLSFEQGINDEDFVYAANEFLDFCEPFIDSRAERIISKLEKLISNE